MRKLAFAVIALLGLSACEITGPTGQQVDETFGYGPPNYAGINQVWLDRSGDGNPDMIATGGKEQGSITIEGFLPDPAGGEPLPFTYTATDVKAFDGQGFRAELEKIIAQANADGIVAMTPELAGVLDSIVNAALKAATGGTL